MARGRTNPCSAVLVNRPLRGAREACALALAGRPLRPPGPWRQRPRGLPLRCRPHARLDLASVDAPRVRARCPRLSPLWRPAARYRHRPGPPRRPGHPRPPSPLWGPRAARPCSQPKWRRLFVGTLRKPSACLRSAPGGRAERDRGARRGAGVAGARRVRWIYGSLL